MKDEDKTNEELMEELDELRRRLAQLEAIELRHVASEAALKQTKEEKQTILDSLVEHVVYHDMEMRILWANRAACESVGLSREELIGRHCYELWSKRSDPCEDCPVKGVRETGQPQALEKTTPDGRSWFIQSSPVRDNNGNTVGMVEFTLDISERKQAEEGLRKIQKDLERKVEERAAKLVTANEQLQREIEERIQTERALETVSDEQAVLLSTVPSMIFWIDNKGRFIRVNDSFAAALNKSPGDITGKSLFDLYPEDMATKYYEDNARVMESGVPRRNIEEPVRTPEGIMWVSTDKIPYKNIMGNIEGIIGFSIDITKRKLAVERLKESEERYRSLVDNIPVGIALISPNMEVLTVNNQLKEWFPDIDLARRPLCYQVFNDPPEEEVCSYCPTIKALQDGKVHDAMTATPAGDQIRHFRIISSPVKDKTGKVLAAIEMVDDITESRQTAAHIRRLSQELITAQEIERQRLAADLHDHLAQDLASLKISLDILYADQPDTPDKMRQRVSKLSGLLEHSIVAVRDMAYGLHPSGLEEFGLVYTARQYCKEFAGKNGLQLDFLSVGMDDLKLAFDKEITLYRLIQEGCTNIQKHADAGHVNVRLSASFSHIMLQIEDNGKGFDVNKRLAAALGERRMGLWGMQQRAALLNGEMKIESGLLHGTKILIKVPQMDETNG